MPPKRGGRAGRGAGRQTAASRAAAASAAAAEPVAISDDSNAATPAAVTVASGGSTPVAISPPPPAAAPPATRSASTAGRAGRATSALKFKPKAIRRGDEEREALAAQEAKKQSDRAAEEARARARANRFRGRRARGGRGAMGRGGGMDGRVAAIPDGPFSQMPGSLLPGGIRSSGGGGGGGGGSGGSGLGGGASGSGGGRSVGVKSEGRVFATGDDYHEREDRLNTELFSGYLNNLEDEVKPETKYGVTRTKKRVLPIGIHRQEVKEAEVVVATTAELEAQEQALAEDSDSDIFVQDDADGSKPAPEQDDAMAEDNAVWAGAPANRRIKVEGEDGEQIEVTDIDTLAETREALAKKAQAKAEAEVEAKAQRKKPAKEKEQEDVVADERLQVMLGELGIQGQQTEEQAAGEAPQADSKDGLLYLFQFPPMLPPLRSVKIDQKDPVKEEPGDDVVMLEDVAEHTSSTVDLTAEVKKEEGADSASPDALNIGQGGFLGTLNIRKSGKAELSWGGQTFEMSQGIDTQYLTTVVLLEEADQKALGGISAQQQPAGQAYGLGKIRGRFNLAPVLGDEDEWEVDREELEV